MDNLPAILALMIPIVAIVGGIVYQMFEKWQDADERINAIQANSGGDALRQRVQDLEDNLALMRTELVDRSQDIEERLMRIEILLKEVG